MSTPIRVTVWNEFRHEKRNDKVKAVYPDGMHAVIAQALNAAGGMTVRTATLDEPEHGLTPEVLAETDVLTWWGHTAHGDVKDEVVKRVQERVLQGMGLIVLHSGHHSKVFKALMGTTGNLRWREAGEKERIWTVSPGHPIARGVGEFFELAHEEMYGEQFDGPQPDRDTEGEEIPAWVVYVGDADAEPTGRIYTLHHFQSAELLAYQMATDRRLDLIHEATPA